MPDQILNLQNSVIQHGPVNDRIYLIKLGAGDTETVIEDLDQLAQSRNYSKIFAKVPEYSVQFFMKHDYIREAAIPNFFCGKEDVYFYSKFLDENRHKLSLTAKKKIYDVLQLAGEKKRSGYRADSALSYEIRVLQDKDAAALASVYQCVFETYPFPIHDSEFLLQSMHDSTMYFGVFDQDRLIAAASAEMDRENRNAEMTDFATLPEFRGQGLALHLLSTMEVKMKKLNILTLYTIARAFSAGMNITFAKMGYSFSGTLINNTQIAGSIESMNVWHKEIRS